MIEIFGEGFWKDLNLTSNEHEELHPLTERLKKTVLAGRAHSTVISYLRSMHKWKSFATRYNFCYFPAEPTAVALYLQHIIETTKSYHAVDAAYYAISWAQPLTSLASCSENAIVKSVREGAKRLLGTAQINRKEPLTLDQLNLLIRKADLTNGLALRNVCMNSLAFAGLLRFDDLIRIRRSDLVFHSDHLEISIAKSKNDQLRKGNVVLISDSPSDTSPVQLIKLYLSRLQIPDDCNKFIFRPLVKSKSSHSLIAIDRHISYSTFREHLKFDLFGIADDPSKFGSHSLRSGGATRAANAGIEERLIQRHGRWRSVSSKNMYMDDALSKKLEVSNVIQS